METLVKGMQGTAVRRLQKLLVARGYPVAVDGTFGPLTERGVRAFQSQNLDPRGHPLVVDGRVGPLTGWSLTHPKPDVPAPDDPLAMPSGGSRAGRAALATALEELRKNAGEIGGNNRGLWVRKYLHGLAPEGSSWCAAFVSWCYQSAPGGIPFGYTVGARKMLAEFRDLGWSHPPGDGYLPAPGDVVVWWRVSLEGWMGHAGMVYEVRDGILYTIEGNRSPQVRKFDYVLSRMEKLLGFGHVP
jgi:peptidoglycan hydrolase-like protein with peptidoglycan-binding domain